MNKDKKYQVLLSFSDGKWEAYYDYGTKQPASATGYGESPEEAVKDLSNKLP